jgi:hypothetical protein
MYEHKHEPLLPHTAFILRMLSHAGFALAVIVVSLVIGMLGYHLFEGLDWVDAFLNASMILGGMGPVSALQTEAGKIFAGCYALYAGLVLLLIAGILLAPLLHRLLHHFHLEMEENGDPGKRKLPTHFRGHDA